MNKRILDKGWFYKTSHEQSAFIAIWITQIHNVYKNEVISQQCRPDILLANKLQLHAVAVAVAVPVMLVNIATRPCINDYDKLFAMVREYPLILILVPVLLVKQVTAKPDRRTSIWQHKTQNTGIRENKRTTDLLSITSG